MKTVVLEWEFYVLSDLILNPTGGLVTIPTHGTGIAGFLFLKSKRRESGRERDTVGSRAG